MKKWIYKTVILATIAVFCSCDAMLDLTPEDKVTGNNFWIEKGQVETAMVGGFGRLQECLYSFYAWGELRSDLVYVVGGSGGGHADRVNANNNMITQENGLNDWGAVYSAINQFNFVIHYAPQVQAADRSFSDEELAYFLGEARTMRALCYFYLARTFEQLPYITAASQTDEQRYDYEPIPATAVLDSIVKDLLWAETRVRENYNDVNFATAALRLRYDKGRVTRPIVWALLADVYLTQNNYDRSIEYSDKIINSGLYSLASGPQQWYSIFYPGNSSEGIFELQFAREYNNSGNFVRWFSNQSSVSGDNWYQIRMSMRTRTYLYWEGDDIYSTRMVSDDRGRGGTYPYEMYSMPSMPVWKWIGIKHGSDDEDYRNASYNDPNWIFYRLADIYLMKAEALNRQGNMVDAARIVQNIRTRVAVQAEVSYSSQNELENIILDERASELAFEGKRWFDIVRIARRQNDYNVIADRLALAWTQSPLVEAVYRARVADPQSWYFPIHRNELEKNPNLRQNIYYR